MTAGESITNFEAVICHGSFHSADHYQPLITSLKEHNVNAECPNLPAFGLVPISNDINQPKVSGHKENTPSIQATYPLLSDDALVFRAVLERKILESGKNILIIAHSAGGLAATEAVTPNLEYTVRKAQGLQGGVLGIFYLCAFVLPPGDSQDGYWQGHMKLEDIIQNYVFKSWPNKGEYEFGTTPFFIAPKDPVDLFYHDLPADTAKRWASILVDLPGPQDAKLTNASYLRLPCAYLFTKMDRVLPLSMQEDMTGKANALGVQFKEFWYDGGHSPQLSWTDGVVKSALEFVREIEFS